MVRLLSATFVAVLALGLAPTASPQGVQTGSVRGVVKDATGQVVPAVTIHAVSSALQGGRVTTSDDAGAYLLQALAPGEYTITFELAGFQAVNSTLRVGVGATERLDAALQPEGVPATVQVQADKHPLLRASAR